MLWPRLGPRWRRGSRLHRTPFLQRHGGRLLVGGRQLRLARIAGDVERLVTVAPAEDAQDLPADAQPYYRELLTEKISVLVSKAIQVYERSLEMATRVGEQNEWVERTTRALERMKTLAVAAIRG